MRWRPWLLVGLVVLASLLVGGIAMAQETQQERGLFVTPPRQYKTVGAGKTIHDEFTVGNANDTTMQVMLSVEQFSVADYTYDYVFKAPKDNWITLSASQLELDAKESHKVTYTIAPPADATPGGHYFSIFASATLRTGKQVRTAMVLYLTVGGDLVRTSEITSDTIPSVWTGGDLPLAFNAKSTGNTHFFIYASARLNGWLTSHKTAETAHILLPQTIRSIETSIPPPVLPGFYGVTYSYKTEDGQYKERTKQVVYAPLWFFATAAGVGWLIVLLVRRGKRLTPWIKKRY